MLVFLHTWFGDYQQASAIPLLESSQRMGWAFLHPNFRGPNTNSDAMGSMLAVSDVVASIEAAKKRGPIDPDRIYLVGQSGGGHMGLLLLALHPEIWAGVSVWSPIVDLNVWANEVSESKWRLYHDPIASVCGFDGVTGIAAAQEECARRSPITYLQPGSTIPVAIHAGIADGHLGSVPITHAMRAFNALVPPAARIGERLMSTLARDASVPAEEGRNVINPSIGGRKALFVRKAGNVSLTLFDGHHEILFSAVSDWLINLDRTRLGDSRGS